MKRHNILITAGPTVEAIDPVRYLSNHSSGKMGYALAQAALRKGHKVTLVSGPTNLKAPKEAKLISVITAKDMHAAVIKHYRQADVMIMVAAVADYRPQKVAKQKIKKTKDQMLLKLVKNPDILKDLGTKKRSNQILVGFAAETNQAIANANKKLKTKNCDWIVVNNVARKGIGFGSDQNQVTLLNKLGKQIKLPKQTKTKLAGEILKMIISNHT